MAKSKYEYVKEFEADESLLMNCWFVIRVDGRAFHKFTSDHEFVKPNDLRGLRLMNAAAHAVVVEFPDIELAYGHSDEYSFLFNKRTQLWKRRKYKIVTSVVSLFSATYVMYWNEHMKGTPLKYAPLFDARVVMYPDLDNVMDYFKWRQVDCHINNLYNTCFWNLVKTTGKSPREARAVLNNTQSKDKQNLLFETFNINYNDEPEICKKGSIYRREIIPETIPDATDATKEKQPKKKRKPKRQIALFHEDLTRDGEYWEKHQVLSS